MEKKTTETNWIDKFYHSSIEYIVNYRKHVKEYALAIIIVLFIRSTVGVVYQIPTGSMIPTFKVGDTLLANRFYYGLKIPFTDEKPRYRLPAIKPLEIGDIAIFRGPKEEIFYHITLNYTSSNQEDQDFFNLLNRASEFKGLIDYQNHNIFNLDENYIIMGRYGDEVEIRLHEDIYHEYRDRLQKLEITDSRKDVLITSYRVKKPLSFFQQLINTPLAGISMIVTVLARTPYFALHAQILIAMFPEWERGGEITFYPNRSIDTTKEYVKRVIAQGGDKVEIHNKIVYVNDQKLDWDSNIEMDLKNSQFLLTREDLPHSPYSQNKSFSHPLRFSTSLITPSIPFNSEYWPFDIETRLSTEYRDNFGPIVVPDGHYFMMGDNRDESLDSRYIGPVPKEMISGTPMVIFFPWNRRGVVE